MASYRISSFRRAVWRHYKAHGRRLPWRATRDPYRILVSEIMLQQTQVERVLPLYKKFIQKFPIAASLASASLVSVLRMWQGLGYNRRAKLLKSAAIELERGTRVEDLPGVGPYTARAVAAFAFNEDVVLVETNIRTAVIHHFFSKREKVSDADIEKVLVRALPRGKAREWYSALMDYGAHLKQSGIRLNARSVHYKKQSKFSGSLREVRGAILRAILTRTSLTAVRRRFPDRFDRAYAALRAEGLITSR